VPRSARLAQVPQLARRVFTRIGESLTVTAAAILARRHLRDRTSVPLVPFPGLAAPVLSENPIFLSSQDRVGLASEDNGPTTCREFWIRSGSCSSP
jgi:hypothetical protein